VLAVDTDVIVPLPANDVPARPRWAARVFANNEIFMAKTVLLEVAETLHAASSGATARIAIFGEKLAKRARKVTDVEVVKP
jgi:hypothetical protein